jgi:hypothetical protein
MAATVHRLPKVVAFNATGIGKQAYELRKQMQDLKQDVPLFTETHLKQHTRFCVPNYHIYRNDGLDGNKGGTAVAVKKRIPHTYVDLTPLLSLEATGVSIPIGHTEMLLASVYKSPLRAWRDADIKEILNLRKKSILAGDLNEKHPVWNSKVSNPSGLKLLDLFVNCNFGISAPQHPTHFVPNGRDVLDIVVHKDVRLSEVRVMDITDSDHLPIMLCILNHSKGREILDPVENFTDWERFHGFASALLSPRVEINSCIEADKAARDFAASIASAYRLSTKTTRISDRNRGSFNLEGLLKHRQRFRKLRQETKDTACKTAVNRFTKTIRRIARKRANERWETKIENCEVTPQTIWPIAKSLIKRGEPKATTAIHGPLAPIFYPNEKANVNCKLLRKPVHTAQRV